MSFGDRPSRRSNYSWITQRILNKIPEWSYARSNPTSTAQQLLNPLGEEIQNTITALMEERLNTFLSTCSPSLLDHLYQADLGRGFLFDSEETFDGQIRYLPPRVWALINNIETEIAQAEYNDLETLYYFCLPTRIEGLNKTEIYTNVIDAVPVSSLSSQTPNDLIIDGHLFITLSDNNTWELRFKDRVYYSKIKIIGESRKGTEIEEVVPLRYNGTFKTKNQWKSVSEVFASYLDSTATISISCLPFYEDPILDTRNISAPVVGGERNRFFSLSSESYGSILDAQSFSVDNLDDVRLGLDSYNTDYSLELLDENDNNIIANDFVLKPNSDWIYVIDNDYFYVYDRNLPFPNVDDLRDEDAADTKMSLVSDLFVYKQGDTATVSTRQINVSQVPSSVRWSILLPSGEEYRVGADGSYWPTTVQGWIINDEYDTGGWKDYSIDFVLSTSGQYVITIECVYQDENYVLSTRTTKLMLYVPAINPEVQIALPNDLKNCTRIFFDTDNNLWFYNGTSILQAKAFHDYFAVDYQNKTVWLTEQYSHIKVQP